LLLAGEIADNHDPEEEKWSSSPGMPSPGMSALPPKADINKRRSDVR